MDPTIEVPGTGQTVGELQALGYDETEIQSLFSSGDIPTTGLTDTAYGPSAQPSNGSGGSNTDWISGLTGFLNGAGTAITNIVRAIDPPRAGTPVYNPQTGLPYGIDPRTGKPVLSAQTSNLATIAFFAFLVLAVLWTVKKL